MAAPNSESARAAAEGGGAGGDAGGLFGSCFSTTADDSSSATSLAASLPDSVLVAELKRRRLTVDEAADTDTDTVAAAVGQLGWVQALRAEPAQQVLRKREWENPQWR